MKNVSQNEKKKAEKSAKVLGKRKRAESSESEEPFKLEVIDVKDVEMPKIRGRPKRN